MSAAATLALLASLHGLLDGYGGNVALYARDLGTGREVAINADAPVPTASVIKLTILFEALKQIQEGRAHFNDVLTMNKRDQVAGSGVLTLFDTPMRLTFKDALTMMIATSDNTGTNLVIDHVGLANVDSRITWMGLKDTWLYKKVFTPPVGPMPADQKQFGLGKTTAREMAAMMTRFAICNLNAPGSSAPETPSAQDRALCDRAIAMLKHQTDGNSIPRYLGGIDVANKTGSLDDVRNDVAIVYAKSGPIVISAFTYANKDQSWTPDNAGALLIGRMAKTIVDEWQ